MISSNPFIKSDATINLNKNFDRIYIIYFSRMCRFAKEYVGNDEDAENLIQDIFLDIYQKKHVVKLSCLDSFLFKTTKNSCINYLKHKAVREKFYKEFSFKLEALEQLNTVSYDKTELENIINSSIQKLPPRCREIFIKSRMDNMKYKEIAEELNISESTVETQMNIALTRLREEMKDYLPFFLFFIM